VSWTTRPCTLDDGCDSVLVCAWRVGELVGVSTRGTLLGQGYLAQLAVLPSQRGHDGEL
jgi:hypothetical protein